MKNLKQCEKEHVIYNADNKKCNALILALDNFYNFIESKEGRSDHENYLLMMLERETNQLKYTLECYKKELDKNHFKAIELLKK